MIVAVAACVEVPLLLEAANAVAARATLKANAERMMRRKIQTIFALSKSGRLPKVAKEMNVERLNAKKE